MIPNDSDTAEFRANVSFKQGKEVMSAMENVPLTISYFVLVFIGITGNSLAVSIKHGLRTADHGPRTADWV